MVCHICGGQRRRIGKTQPQCEHKWCPTRTLSKIQTRDALDYGSHRAERLSRFISGDDLRTDGGQVEGVCHCESPEVVRTMAKGTPAETEYCECGGLIR